MTTPRRVSRQQLAGGLDLRTGPANELELEDMQGELHVLVVGRSGVSPVPGEAWEISGPHDITGQGTTGQDGLIDIPGPCPIDVYDLSILGKTFKVDARYPGMPPVIVHVDDWPALDPARLFTMRSAPAGDSDDASASDSTDASAVDDTDTTDGAPAAAGDPDASAPDAAPDPDATSAPDAAPDPDAASAPDAPATLA